MKNFVSKVFRWWQLPLLAPLLGVIFAFMLVVPAWAATTTTTNIPIASVISDPCTQELVTFQGNAQVISTTTMNANEALVQQRIVVHATGTGVTSHNTYIVNDEFSEQFNSAAGFVHTETGISTIISPGGVSTAHLQLIFHTTVNPNGTVTVAITDITITCS